MTTFKRDFDFNDDFMINVSKNIKKYRLKAGITQEQLAVDVGKSYDFIRRLEYKKGDKYQNRPFQCLYYHSF